MYSTVAVMLCSFYLESTLNEHITCMIRFILAELSATMLSLCLHKAVCDGKQPCKAGNVKVMKRYKVSHLHNTYGKMLIWKVRSFVRKKNSLPILTTLV